MQSGIFKFIKNIKLFIKIFYIFFKFVLFLKLLPLQKKAMKKIEFFPLISSVIKGIGNMVGFGFTFLI